MVPEGVAPDERFESRWREGRLTMNEPVSASTIDYPGGRVPAAAEQMVREMAALAVGDPGRARLRDRVIEAWLPLAQLLARRYYGRGEPDDDLVQTATIGLIKAVDRFDPDRGIEFAGFAIPTILGEVKRHFRDRTWSIRVPRRLQELRIAITAASNLLGQTLGRSPTVADVAAHLGITEEEVLEGLEGARAYSATSLSTPFGANGDQELGDILGGDDHEYDLVEMRASLGPALALLEPREQKIIALRFFGNMTQSRIAEELGISQMHVSRLLRRSLEQMGATVGHADPPQPS
jgi:RNA polymerase sigma-B factor